MSCCITIQFAGLIISLIDLVSFDYSAYIKWIYTWICTYMYVGIYILNWNWQAFNFVGIFLSSAVLVYSACFKIKCRIPVTVAITKEIHRQYSVSVIEHEEELVELSNNELGC